MLRSLTTLYSLMSSLTELRSSACSFIELIFPLIRLNSCKDVKIMCERSLLPQVIKADVDKPYHIETDTGIMFN